MTNIEQPNQVDFSNFELTKIGQGRGVSELADGLIPEMAEVFSVELSDRPTVDELGALVGAIGKSKILEENLPQVQAVLGNNSNALQITSQWQIRSGVQKPLDRSLWTPESATPDELAGVVLTGAAANWIDRTTKLLVDRHAAGYQANQVYIPVGNEVLQTATDIVNPNVVAFAEAHNGQQPTQAQYVQEFTAPALRAADHEVRVIPYETKKGAEIAAAFVEGYNHLLTGKLAFVRVANAGIQLAMQFRTAAQAKYPSFDTNPSNPQAYILTDGFPVAQTPEQNVDPVHYQRPATGIGMIARTAKYLAQAAN